MEIEDVKCSTCFKQVPKGAKKCTHCGTFQNWRRYLDFGKNFLALMIAFISVITVLVTQLKSVSEKDVSNAYVEAFIMNSNGISLITSNTGNVPGFIKSCQLDFMDNNQVVTTYNLTLDEEKNSSRIIEAGKNSEIFFKINSSWLRESICTHINQNRNTLYKGDRFKGKIRFEIANYNPEYNRINTYSKGENYFLIKDLIHSLTYKSGGFECSEFLKESFTSRTN